MVAHQTLEATPDSFGEHGRHCAHRERKAGQLPLSIEHNSDQALLIFQALGVINGSKGSQLLVVVAGAQPQGLGTLWNESDHQKNLSALPIPFNATPVAGPKDTISAPQRFGQAALCRLARSRYRISILAEDRRVWYDCQRSIGQLDRGTDDSFCFVKHPGGD